jgi:hypothetical protein
MNSEKVNDPKIITDAFSACFLITKYLDFHQEARGDAISFIKNAFPIKFHGFKIIPTTETEIKIKIHSLKEETLQVMME